MGISISIENDANYEVNAEIQLKGSTTLARRKIAPGDTWKKTDGGIAASCVYDVVIHDEQILTGDDQFEFRYGIRAPKTAGVKKVLVSEVLKKGKTKASKERHSRRAYILSLWSQLDQDGSGKIDRGEFAEWVRNECFCNNRAFKGRDPEELIKEMFHAMDKDHSGDICEKEFVKYFDSLDRDSVTQLGFTILDFQRARLNLAALPFYLLKKEGEHTIPTKALRNWFTGDVKMSRAKDLLGDMKDRLAAIKAKPDLTFWEWMNLVCPAKEDRNVNNITEIGDIRTLAGEIIGLPKSDIEVLKKMCPKMNIVIMICGSRGDVQPFLPIGQALKNLGHRVRIATHANFREFVESNGCEFYPLGGDPKKLMAYMVKSKGKLMPSTSELLSSSFWEETAERKEMMEEIIMSCYDAANCADKESKGSAGEPFTADFIISNPTTYSHVHLAEAMGVPVHMFFTMPWSPTSQFPHPLGGVAYKELTGKDKKKFEASPDKGDVKDMDSFLENFQKIQATKSKKSDANSYSYKSVDWLMHMGMGELLQKFRVKHNLTKTWKEGADIVNSRGLPFAYIWSPSLIPKPEDWGANIDIVGFCELKGSGFTGEPPADIKAWLEKDPEKPPIFIGFGSCVLPDPRKVAKNIYYAAQKADVRVIIQQGWAELGKSLTGKDGVSFVKGTKLDDGSESEGYDIKANDFALVIGRVSHSWLFDHVTGVVHHGGAGTTYAGLKAAKPTFVAPFFGDQPFWGQMVSAAGAGPKPQGVDDWEEESLAKKFLEMCGEPMKKAAKGLSDAMAKENGAAKSIDAIYSHLYFHQLHCDLILEDVARYYVPNWKLRLGDRGMKIMEKHKPSWFPKIMGTVHRYKSTDWTMAGTPTYFKDNIESIDNADIKITEEEIKFALRNLKAIIDERAESKHESHVDFVHPEPRLRM